MVLLIRSYCQLITNCEFLVTVEKLANSTDLKSVGRNGLAGSSPAGDNILIEKGLI
jgi:hypothetical protein